MFLLQHREVHLLPPNTHCSSMDSHTWHRVVSSLVAQGTSRSLYTSDHSASRCSTLLGYLMTAPNLVGHTSRVSTDYHINSIADDLRPYLEARNYSLIIGHSLGAATALSLFSHLPPSHPTAIVLVDPPMKQTSEKLDYLDAMISDSCINIKSAEAYGAENPFLDTRG